MAQTRRTLRPQVPFRSNLKVGTPTGRSCRCTVSSIADGLRSIRRIQAMTFSKLPFGVPLAAFVFCVFAVLGPSTGPLLADGMTASHLGAVSARPGFNPDRILNRQAIHKSSNNQIFR